MIVKYVVNSGEVHTIVDIARLSVKYRTVDELVRCIQRITASASDLHKDGIELCWLDNKFDHPSPVGYADVNACLFFLTDLYFDTFRSTGWAAHLN